MAHRNTGATITLRKWLSTERNCRRRSGRIENRTCSYAATGNRPFTRLYTSEFPLAILNPVPQFPV